MKPQILFDKLEAATYVFTKIHGRDWDIRSLPKDRYAAIGITRYGKLIGGCVWTNWSIRKADIEVSLCGFGAWNDARIRAFLFDVSFNYFKVAHITARTCEDNVRAIKGLKRVGFKLEGRQKRAYDGVKDVLLFGATN